MMPRRGTRRRSDAPAGREAGKEGWTYWHDEGAILRLHERLRDVARGGATRALIHNDGAPGTGSPCVINAT